LWKGGLRQDKGDTLGQGRYGGEGGGRAPRGYGVPGRYKAAQTKKKTIQQ